MKSRINILTFLGRSFRLRSSFAVTVGYALYSSDMSRENSSVRCCQSLSFGVVVNLAPRVMPGRVAMDRLCCCVLRPYWTDEDKATIFRREWHAGCRNSCRKSWVTIGESMTGTCDRAFFCLVFGTGLSLFNRGRLAQAPFVISDR
jgi:hypothetical protein